ncbi:MAG: MBL fold metallo-hydrolase [Alphaproteobacteria bacterium]|nr:MBL fold metallo-hydrolase [Alphaproteobacteria bacterium]
MPGRHLGALAAILAAGLLAAMPAEAQQQRPPIQTTKVEGTDNVYIFRNVNHQAMFVVTSEGVIATDPVAYGKPDGGRQYVEEIRKVTSQPIKYVIYSHHHYDHIAGGKAFKDAGATFISHANAKKRLVPLKDPHTVIPDKTFNKKMTLTLGGTALELIYLGPNHSDSNIVMRLPKEKIIFLVDTIPVGTFPGRGFIDIDPLKTETFIERVLALDWDRMIPGHPGQPGDRLGTKKDAQDVLTLMREASADMKKLAQESKCWEPAEREYKMPKYASWPGYEAGMPLVARRYCGLWGRGT